MPLCVGTWKDCINAGKPVLDPIRLRGKEALFLVPILLLSIGPLASCSNQPATESLGTRPNILLIVADDLGYTDLGCYGGEIKTPHLDALAREGIRNTAFYTAPTCSPTRAMLLSGVDNHRNGYGTMEGDWAENQKGLRGYEGHLNFDVVSFPTLLRDGGYHTSIAGKWHQAFPADREELWPGKRGFDRSFCLLQGGAGHFADQQRMFSFFERTLYAEDGEIVDELPEDFYSSHYYTQKAIEYIDESQELNQPFFSYIAYTAPHWPLQVPDENIELYKGRYDQGYEVLAHERLKKGQQLGVIQDNAVLPPLTPNVLPWDELGAAARERSSRIMEVYAAMIEQLDANVGRLIAHLKLISQYENTLIVFMADNGAEGNWVGGIEDTADWVAQNFDNSLENIGRKNSYVWTGPSWAQVSSLPFKWYKSFTTEGGVRCPSIISYAKWKHNQGKINRNYLSVMDLAPTFLELAGVGHPGEQYEGRTVFPLDGVSMVDWLTAKAETVHETDAVHCSELYGRKAVRKGSWKGVWTEKPYGSGSWKLFNLAEDPSESHNLAESDPALLKELVAAWDAYALKYKVTLPSTNVAYSADLIWQER